MTTWARLAQLTGKNERIIQRSAARKWLYAELAEVDEVILELSLKYNTHSLPDVEKLLHLNALPDTARAEVGKWSDYLEYREKLVQIIADL